MSALQLSLFQKLLKFAVVGTSGLCIDFSVTWLCRERLTLNQYIANTAGFTIAVCSNFLLNYLWTFNGEVTNIPLAFGSFAAIALLGLLLNTGALYVCNHVIGFEFYRAKVMAVGIVFLWNFGANYFITFSRRQTNASVSVYHSPTTLLSAVRWSQI